MRELGATLVLISMAAACGSSVPPAASPDQPPPPPPAVAPQPSTAADVADTPERERTADALTIFAVDIGQGDATVVLGPKDNEGRRKVLVMDAGNRAPDGGKIVGDLLASQGIEKVDYVILSHFDGDHIGGFVTVSGSTSLLWTGDQCVATKWFPTKAIFDQGKDTNQSKSSAEWRKCVPKIAAAKGVTHTKIEEGAGLDTVLDLGDGYKATIVVGDGYVVDRSERVSKVNTPNERSIAVLVSGEDGFDMLITGDLIGRESGAEDARVEAALGAALKARGIDVEVLRTGHHGAANATEVGFVRDINPEVAIISAGDDQASNYRHPRCATYESLKQAEVGLVLQTELGKSDCASSPPLTPVVANGTIRIDVDGATYRVTNEGDASPANGQPTQSLDRSCTLEQGCCCKRCTSGKPCGDTCISASATCSKAPGCACSAH